MVIRAKGGSIEKTMREADNIKIKLEVTFEDIPYQIDDKTFNSITYIIMESLLKQ